MPISQINIARHVQKVWMSLLPPRPPLQWISFCWWRWTLGRSLSQIFPIKWPWYDQSMTKFRPRIHGLSQSFGLFETHLDHSWDQCIYSLYARFLCCLLKATRSIMSISINRFRIRIGWRKYCYLYLLEGSLWGIEDLEGMSGKKYFNTNYGSLNF